jgi:hypothetical protein
MRTPTVDQIIRAIAHRGYKVFDSPDGYGLNLVGIRSQSTGPNQFDDLLAVFHRRLGIWNSIVIPVTTDPGLYWLENPMNVNGTAILKPGQYAGAFAIGKHQGKYDALVQRQPLTVIRDYDRDAELDLSTGREETGLFGINIHCAKWEGESTLVDKWSAGCQVVASWWDFQILMLICRAAERRHGNAFTYTLLTEADFGLVP